MAKRAPSPTGTITAVPSDNAAADADACASMTSHSSSSASKVLLRRLGDLLHSRAPEHIIYLNFIRFLRFCLSTTTRKPAVIMEHRCNSTETQMHPMPPPTKSPPVNEYAQASAGHLVSHMSAGWRFNMFTTCGSGSGLWLSHHAAVRDPLVSRVEPDWVCGYHRGQAGGLRFNRSYRS